MVKLSFFFFYTKSFCDHLNILELYKKPLNTLYQQLFFSQKLTVKFQPHFCFLFEDIVLFCHFRQTEKWVSVLFGCVQIITCVPKLLSLRNAWPEAEKWVGNMLYCMFTPTSLRGSNFHMTNVSKPKRGLLMRISPEKVMELKRINFIQV